MAKWVRASGIGAIVVFVTYWCVFEAYSVRALTDGERVVIGSRYRPEIKELLTTTPGTTAADALAAAAWNARAIWEEETVTAVETTVFLIWVIVTVCTAVCFSCFSLQQAKRRFGARGRRNA